MRSEAGQLRIQYLKIFLILFLIEFFIALFVRDRFIRPYLGDMLVVLLVYFAVRIIFPTGLRWLPFGVFLFAAGIEGLQYLQFVKLMKMENNPLIRTIIGMTFDWKDVWCYAVGGIAAGFYQYGEAVVRKHRQVKRRDIGVAAFLIITAVLSVKGITYWEWLGSPKPAQVVLKLSDSYPGHSLNCLRGEAFQDKIEAIFPEDYESMVGIYGEPASTVLEYQDGDVSCYLYGYRGMAVIYQHLDNGSSLFMEAYIYHKDIKLPLSGIKVGTRRSAVAEAYRRHETMRQKATSITGYTEPICMLCQSDKFYEISFDYEEGSTNPMVNQIHIICHRY